VEGYRGRHSAPEPDESDVPLAAPPEPGRPKPPVRAELLEQARRAAPVDMSTPAADAAPAADAVPSAHAAPAADTAPEPAPEPPAVPDRFPVAELEPEPVQEWVAIPPPQPVYLPAAPGPAPQAPASWETPAGFVPLVAPRRSVRSWRLIAAVVAVVALGAAGWFFYSSVSSSKPAAAPQAPAPAATVSYTSPEGHFTVRLPAEPKTTSASVNQDGYAFQMYLATDPVDKQAAGGYVVTPDIPSDRVELALRDSLEGMAHGATLTDLANGTYQGYPSATATITDNTGSSVHVMTFAYSANRVYLLIAADEASLASLEVNFSPIP
jgi:hypothetical protein